MCFFNFVDDGTKLFSFVVNISPNQIIRYTIPFLHRLLFLYSFGGSRILRGNIQEFPIILPGDLKVHFLTDESVPSRTFRQDEVYVIINNDHLYVEQFGIVKIP